MTDRELLKQALEALESCDVNDREVGDQYYDSKLVDAAYNALRERLAQPEQPTADEVIASHAKRLALELEGVLLECEDTSATSKWWGSAYQAIHNFHDDVDRMYPQDHVSPLGKD